MSEIGAVDSPYSKIMQFAGFSLLGIVWILFSLLLFLELRKNAISLLGIGLIFIGALAMFAVGFYPCDAHCVNITDTGKMHSILAMISNIFFIIGMLVLHFEIRKDSRFSKNIIYILLGMTIISNVLSPLIGFPQLESFTGLIQRLAIGFPLV